MIRESLLKELMTESAKQEPMPATTIRLPREVYEEMEAFAKANKIHFAVLLRRTVAVGWKNLREDLGINE